MKKLRHFARNRYIFCMDILLTVLSYAFVIALTYSLTDFGQNFITCLPSMASTLAVLFAVFWVFRIYSVYWLYSSIKEYMRLFAACCTVGVFAVVADAFLMRGTEFDLKFSLAVNLITMAMVIVLRMSARMLYTIRNAGDDKSRDKRRVLIVGAGQLSAMLLNDIRSNRQLPFTVVGLIDDDKLKQNRIMYGAKVLGGRGDIERICREEQVEEIIFAIYTISPEEKNKILELCTQTGCKIKVMPGVEAVLSGSVTVDKMRSIQIEDLLERDTVLLNNASLKADICGKTVMVTGGGGSIGSELCRQIARFSPKLLIILDIYENTTYDLQNELLEHYPDLPIEVLIASVRDTKRLEELFSHYRPEMVFHAAAHKHVPLMEDSPGEAVKNNVFGTLNVAKCADKFGVKRFVMISTDKAVNPTNVMGATKRMCEMIIQTMATVSKTEFVAVRFGNVLGSNGSVIPRFKRQIAAGGPVTVTDPEITRFFMTIPEAASLVLQAAANARGGEIFVLDMGQPVKIYDLAKKMIQLAGYKPGRDIKIVFSGLRPGEKLYEELLMNEEGLRKTEHSKIFIGSPISINEKELENKLKRLSQALEHDDAEIKKALQEVIPTYHPSDATTASQA